MNGEADIDMSGLVITMIRIAGEGVASGLVDNEFLDHTFVKFDPVREKRV